MPLVVSIPWTSPGWTSGLGRTQLWTKTVKAAANALFVAEGRAMLVALRSISISFRMPNTCCISRDGCPTSECGRECMALGTWPAASPSPPCRVDLGDSTTPCFLFPTSLLEPCTSRSTSRHSWSTSSGGAIVEAIGEVDLASVTTFTIFWSSCEWAFEPSCLRSFGSCWRTSSGSAWAPSESLLKLFQTSHLWTSLGKHVIWSDKCPLTVINATEHPNACKWTSFFGRSMMACSLQSSALLPRSGMSLVESITQVPTKHALSTSVVKQVGR